MFLKLASFFIQEEKGLRRPGRAESRSAWCFVIGMRKGCWSCGHDREGL